MTISGNFLRRICGGGEKRCAILSGAVQMAGLAGTTAA
jgi:hypothetical protein